MTATDWIKLVLAIWIIVSVILFCYWTIRGKFEALDKKGSKFAGIVDISVWIFSMVCFWKGLIYLFITIFGKSEYLRLNFLSFCLAVFLGYFSFYYISKISKKDKDQD